MHLYMCECPVVLAPLPPVVATAPPTVYRGTPRVTNGGAAHAASECLYLCTSALRPCGTFPDPKVLHTIPLTLLLEMVPCCLALAFHWSPAQLQLPPTAPWSVRSKVRTFMYSGQRCSTTFNIFNR